MALGVKAGGIYLDLNINQKGFNTQLNGIGKIATKAGKLVAAAFAVKDIIRFGKACVDLGSDLEEVQNVVDVAFPTMYRQIDNFARGAAKNFGLSETMAKRFTGTFGSMGTAFGFTESQAAEMATTLTGLAGDIASFYNITQDEAYTKLKSVFTGETESLKDLGVVMTQTALDSYALANGFGKTTKSMTEAEKVALRYSFVQNQLSNAAGDFMRTSDSWANQVRVLSLQFDTFKAAIGQGLINVLKPVVKWLNAILEKLIAVAKAFADFTAKFSKKKADSVTSGLSAAVSSADNLGSSTAATADNISAAATSAKELKRTLAGFDQITKVEAETDGITGGNIGLGGISTIIDGNLSRTVASAEEEVTTAWDKIIGIMSNRFQYAFGPLGDIVGYIFKPLIKNGDGIIDVFSTIFDIVGELAEKLTLSKDYEDSYLHKFFEAATEVRTKKISKGLETVNKVLDTLLDLLEKDITFSEAYETIFELITGARPSQVKLSVTTNLKAIRETTFNNAKKAFEEIQDSTVVKTVKGFFGDKFNEVKSKWEAIKDSEVYKTIKGKIESTFESIKEKWEAIKDGSAIKKIKGEVSSTFESIKEKWNSIKDKTATLSLKFSAAASDLKSWINTNVIDRANSALHKVPILKNVNIPHLAQGGYVKANTPQLAVIGDNRHQGEVVSPENKLIEMARKAADMAGGSYDAEIVSLLRQILTHLLNLNLTATVDVVAMKKLIVRLINEHTQSTGVCEIYI